MTNAFIARRTMLLWLSYELFAIAFFSLAKGRAARCWRVVFTANYHLWPVPVAEEALTN